MGDCGLTGRKIIADTYGGQGSHGGGGFSGKDPSKVDRTASYMARYVAKNIVAADLADRVEVQVAYSIGIAEPVSLMIDTFGTGRVSDEKIQELVRELFSFKPANMIKYLRLDSGQYSRRPPAAAISEGTILILPGRKPIWRRPSEIGRDSTASARDARAP